MTKINGNIIQNNLRTDVLNKAYKALDNKNSIDFSSKIHNALKEVADTQTKANQITNLISMKQQHPPGAAAPGGRRRSQRLGVFHRCFIKIDLFP